MKRRSVAAGDVVLEAVSAGSGATTVVFENGLATPLKEWDAVASRIEERTRLLCYDRRQAPSNGHVPMRSALDAVADLEKRLSPLAFKPPYVLVGHSWGAVIARLFAYAHPSEVVGLAIVDGTHEAVDQGFGLLPTVYSLMGIAMRVGAARRWLLQQSCPAGSPASYRARIEQSFADPVQARIGLIELYGAGRGWPRTGRPAGR